MTPHAAALVLYAVLAYLGLRWALPAWVSLAVEKRRGGEGE